VTSSIAQKIPERVDWFLAAFITAAVIALHFFFWRQAGALWRDEINTVNLAQSDSLAAMTRDSFPVLMPLLVKIWSHFSVADISLRFLGLLMGLLIPAAYLAVARVTRRPPLISLTLFGLSPVMICYGDSLRAYGIGSALIVFAVWAVWWFLKSPDWKRALILALVATLSVQALYQNALLFFSVCLGAFSVCARRRNFQAAWKIFCAGLLAAASLLPYFQQFTEMPHATEVFRRGFSLAGLSASFGQAVGFPYPQFIAVWCVLILAAISRALFGIRKRCTGDISLQCDLNFFS
jgi:hypothetical protein